jgi:alanine racemase
MRSRPTVAEINLANLRFNFRSSREFIGADVKYMAVVKADAYGHGAVECSRALVEEGIDGLGVALMEEALELRNTGIDTPILCLGGFFEGQEEELLDSRITPVILDISQAELISKAAALRSETANIHVKIDTGMGRLGVRWDEVEGFLTRIQGLKNLRVEGLMTHFAAADDPSENEFTGLQIDRFYQVVDRFRGAGQAPAIIDLANSPGAVGHPRSRGNMVRLGGILYGLGGDILPPGISKPELRPVMSLRSKIGQIKRVPKGETLGYGRTFRTGRESQIALVPIGYHDGYRRRLSNNSQVIVNGVFAPVVGRISMDWTIVDVTDVPDVRLGDDVVLLGQSGALEIRSEDLARRLDTISYEITCGIGSRVPRRFVE